MSDTNRPVSDHLKTTPDLPERTDVPDLVLPAMPNVPGFPDDAAVVRFLETTPDFFQHHPELLDDLSIPHGARGATSLIEHQVQRLKDRNRAARQQMLELIEIARENDQLSEKIQQVTLELVGARQELTHLVLTLHEVLHWHFEIDTSQLLIMDPPFSRDEVELNGFGQIHSKQPWVIDLERVFESPEPICGRFKPEQTFEIFNFQVGSIGSVALVPLSSDKRRIGLLALGSADRDHFHPTMGTHFLRFLGGVLSLLLEPLIWS